MGLDMYIYKTKKASHSIEELCDLDNNPKEDDPAVEIFLPLNIPFPDHFPNHRSIFTQVAYWRKFNALHNWFVNHVQVGIDDCNYYELFQDHLVDLIDTLQHVLDKQDTTDFEPTAGFFFGSTEVDEYYWELVEITLDEMKHVLDDFDWENERMFYCSSW